MAERSESRVYVFGTFRLDSTHSMLYQDGKEVSLPPKAVETLRILVEREGQILSKDELMDFIWDGVAVEESNLSQYLHRLRKVLGTNSDGTPFIQTLRRRGYRFTGDVQLSSASESIRSRLKNRNSPIGREREISRVAELLGSKNDVRLLTLSGPGGVGKTTLARSVAAVLEPSFPDGTTFVELASVGDPDLVFSTIASAFGLKEAGGKPILEVLRDYLAGRKVLLILDNLEHVISAASGIADLIANTSALKILVTSRVFMNLTAETEFPVPPLAIPSQQALDRFVPFPAKSSNASSTTATGPELDLDEIHDCASVRLFLERSRAVKPGRSGHFQDLRSIGEICIRLNGLPLAIELAAARTRIMSAEGILARLESQLNLLTGGAVDLPKRQQTMRATIAWSYELLDEREKIVLNRLAVFAGGFTLDAADSVANDSLIENGTSHGDDIIDVITALVEQNLLLVSDHPGTPRFSMLQVVREFALERLKESGEEGGICRRHAEYFLRLAKEAEPHLRAAQSGEWLARLEEDHDNLRLALRWAALNDRKFGQQLAASVWRFWLLHGYIKEGREQLGQFLSFAGDAVDGKLATKLLAGIAYLTRLEGDFDGARSLAEKGLLLAKEIGDKGHIAFILYQLGLLALEDDATEAGKLFGEGLYYANECGDEQMLALLLNGLGELSRSEGDLAHAAEFYAQALELNRKLGDQYRQATNLVNLGATALSRNDCVSAGSYYKEGLGISSEMSDIRGTIYCLEGFAGTYCADHRAEKAALLIGAAAATRDALALPIEPVDKGILDQFMARIRKGLPEQTFIELFEAGRKLPIEEAVQIAMAE